MVVPHMLPFRRKAIGVMLGLPPATSGQAPHRRLAESMPGVTRSRGLDPRRRWEGLFNPATRIEPLSPIAIGGDSSRSYDTSALR